MTAKQRAKNLIKEYGKEIAYKIAYEIAWVDDLSEKSYDYYQEVKWEILKLKKQKI